MPHIFERLQAFWSQGRERVDGLLLLLLLLPGPVVETLDDFVSSGGETDKRGVFFSHVARRLANLLFG